MKNIFLKFLLLLNIQVSYSMLKNIKGLQENYFSYKAAKKFYSLKRELKIKKIKENKIKTFPYIFFMTSMTHTTLMVSDLSLFFLNEQPKMNRLIQLCIEIPKFIIRAYSLPFFVLRQKFSNKNKERFGWSYSLDENTVDKNGPDETETLSGIIYYYNPTCAYPFLLYKYIKEKFHTKIEK